MKPIEPMEPMSLGTMERIKNNSIVQAWLVLALSLFFGASLAAVQVTLGPKIEENKINETRERVPELVLGKDKARAMSEKGEKIDAESRTFIVEKSGRKVAYTVFEACDAGKNRLGWVVKTSGQGYADRIELLLGLDPSGNTISGLYILEQKETPGLGNKISVNEWRGQFIGKTTDSSLSVVKGGGASGQQINAISGATISSRSVAEIINTAAADLRGPLAGQK